MKISIKNDVIRKKIELFIKVKFQNFTLTPIKNIYEILHDKKKFPLFKHSF